MPDRDITTSEPGSRPASLVALMLVFFASGAAALIYEVLWLKELGRLFGVTAHSAAVTLSVFFLGLSAGGAVWGRRAAGVRSPLRTYAALEIGIAITACLYFGLVDLFHLIYGPLLAKTGSSGTLATGIKLALATIVLFPPAFFMGGTLPVMAQLLVRRADELGRRASLLYAVNTIGAASGAFLAGFHLPRVLGYAGAYSVAIGINVVAAATTFAWSRRWPAPPPVVPEPRPTAPGHPAEPGGFSLRALGVVAAVSGFVTLGLEVLWTHMFAQILQNSVYTFSAVLTLFLGALALGSVLAGRLCRLRTVSPPLVLGALMIVSGLLVAWTPPTLFALSSGLDELGRGLGWNAYVSRVFVVVGAVLVVPVTVMGAVFPYLMKIGERGMVSAGRTVGSLASINTAAAIVGSVVAGFVLLERWGTWTSIRALAVTYLVLGAVVVRGRSRAALAVRALGIAGAVVFGLLVRWDDLTDVRLDAARHETVVRTWQGPHGTVSVVDADGSLRLKVNNTYTLGSSLSHLNQRLQSQIPLLLHPDPRSVFYLGLGTGVTASGALAFPVDEVVVCELNGDVIEASRTCFAPWLEGLFGDPRVSVLEEDGRVYLATSTDTFDVVIADIFLTYRAGVGALYTREHFEAVRDRLAPGGLFAQWLPMFDLTEEEFGIIVRTMLEVFPEVTLWRRGFSPKFPVHLLLGHESTARLDVTRFRDGLDALDASGVLGRNVWIQNIPLAAYVANLGRLRDAFHGYAVSTDDRVPLEYLAPVSDRDAEVGRATVLAWDALVAFEAGLVAASPPEVDPYLASVPPDMRRQVRAGLAFYGHETHRRMRDSEAAARYLVRYRELVAASGGAGARSPAAGPSADDEGSGEDSGPGAPD